jgi:hypothetical protein
MQSMNTYGKFASHAIVIIIIMMQPPVAIFAANLEKDFPVSLTQSAVSLAVDGDPGAIGILRLLLRLDKNSQYAFSHLMEQTELIGELPLALKAFEPGERIRAEGLLEELAELQGASSISNALTVRVPASRVKVTLKDDEPQWFFILPLAGGPTHVLVRTPQCLPEVSVFDKDVRFPAKTRAGIVRYKDLILGFSINGGVAVRIRRGLCDSNEFPLGLEWQMASKTLDQGDDGKSEADMAGNEVTTIALRGASRSFTVQTEPGFVYRVFAASPSGDVYPILARIDPARPISISDSDATHDVRDAAMLTQFLGTGKSEHFSVSRNGVAEGNVELLVTKHAIRRRDVGQTDVLDVTTDSAAWQLIRLPPGTWYLETRNLSPNFDPVLSVFDAATGKLLERNDDASRRTVASHIRLNLRGYTDLAICMSAASTNGGSGQVEVTKSLPNQSRRRGQST